MRLWLAFSVGLILNMLRQAALVAHSKSNTVVNTIHGYLWRNAIGLTLRAVMDWALWAVITYNPQLFLNRVISIPGTTFSMTVNVPLIVPVYILAGIACDLFWDFVIEHWAWLQSKLPPLE